MSKINVVKVSGEPKKPTILINFILDESGSMQHQRYQVIEGFNEYIQDHKKKNDAEYLITLVKFSGKTETIFANKPVAEVRPISEADYSPAGSTALRDAIGRTIHVSDAARSLVESNPKVLTFIFTDGEENSSTDFTVEQINKMITKREASDEWTFTFIGASADCLKQAAKYGINWGNTIVYNSNNMSGTISALSNATSFYAKNVGVRGSGNTTQFFQDAGITGTADLDSVGAQIKKARTSNIVVPTTVVTPTNIATPSTTLDANLQPGNITQTTTNEGSK